MERCATLALRPPHFIHKIKKKIRAYENEDLVRVSKKCKHAKKEKNTTNFNVFYYNILLN